MKPEKICLLIAAGLFVTAMLIVVGSGIYKEQKYQHERRGREESFKKKLAEERAAFAKLTPKEHLEKMRDLLDPEGNLPSKITEAKRHMNAIPEDIPEYKEAEGLLERRTRTERRVFASKVEYKMLDNGISFRAYTAGENDTILYCEFPILTDVTVHRVSKQFDSSTVRELGFKKVILQQRGWGKDGVELWTDANEKAKIAARR